MRTERNDSRSAALSVTKTIGQPSTGCVLVPRTCSLEATVSPVKMSRSTSDSEASKPLYRRNAMFCAMMMMFPSSYQNCLSSAMCRHDLWDDFESESEVSCRARFRGGRLVKDSALMRDAKVYGDRRQPWRGDSPGAGSKLNLNRRHTRVSDFESSGILCYRFLRVSTVTGYICLATTSHI